MSQNVKEMLKLYIAKIAKILAFSGYMESQNYVNKLI